MFEILMHTIYTLIAVKHEIPCTLDVPMTYPVPMALALHVIPDGAVCVGRVPGRRGAGGAAGAGGAWCWWSRRWPCWSWRWC